MTTTILKSKENIKELAIQVLKSANFTEILEKLNSLDKAVAGKTFEEIAFALIKTKFSTFYGKDTVKLSQAKLSLLNELNISKKDIGADFVGSFKGQKYIFQSKYKSNIKDLLSRNGDKIVSAIEQARCGEDTQLVIITNSYGLSYDVISKMNKGDRFRQDIKVLGYAELLYLTTEEIKAAKDFILSGKVVVAKKYLIPEVHQIQGIEAYLKEFETNNRGYCVYPMGAGKSLIYEKILENEIRKTKGLYGVFVPSLSLAKQAIKGLINNLRVSNYKIVVVCSDFSVGEDLPIYEIPGKVVSTKEEIIQEIKKQGDDSIIFVTTYHSSLTLGKALKKMKTQLEHGVHDEAHRTVVGSADEYSTFSYCLHNKFVPMKKRSFYTATPKLVSEKLFQRYSELGREVPGMNNYNLYGNMVASMTFSEAVKIGRILNPKLYFSMWTKKELNGHALYRKFVENHGKPALTADLVTAVLVLIKVLEDSYLPNEKSGKKTIVYCRNNSESQKMEQLFKQLYKGKEVFSCVVTGKDSSGLRADFFKQFEDAERGVMFNCKTLVEGVDIPCADTAIFASPKKSVVDTAQAVGRIIRFYSKDLEKSPMIIVPVFHEIKKEADYIQKGAYKDVINTIRALMEFNDIVKEYINKIIEGNTPSESPIIEGTSLVKEGFVSLKEFVSNKNSLVFKEFVFKAKGSTWETKQILLKLKYKPSKYSKNIEEKRLASKLGSYVNESSEVYDPEFVKRVKKEAPHLLKRMNGDTSESKEKLLKLKYKPSGNSKDKEERSLASKLSSYVNESSRVYDPEFVKRAKKEAPYLLKRMKGDTSESKEKLLKLKYKPSGNSKNKEERNLAIKLRSYVIKSSGGYDPEFVKRVKKEAPHLLVSLQDNRVDKVKENLLKLKCKPSSKSKNKKERTLAIKLGNYIRKTSLCYDPKFVQRAKKQAPYLLVSLQDDRVNKTKEKLLKLKYKPSKRSRNKQEKKLGIALGGYINKSSRGYDIEFIEKAKKQAPHLLKKMSGDSSENKEKLLNLKYKPSFNSKNKEERRLAVKLGNYIRKTSNCYDPEFVKKVRKQAPYLLVNLKKSR